nr:uroporphyrinogen-III C-methyltransferase [Methylonatrum kenyense]
MRPEAGACLVYGSGPEAEARMAAMRVAGMPCRTVARLADAATEDVVLLLAVDPDPAVNARALQWAQRHGIRLRYGAGCEAESTLQLPPVEADQLPENGAEPRASTEGEVYLIGAGPGDPELLTRRALRLLQAADVVLYDRLVAPAILALIPPHCERINVGKQRDRHPVPQEEINGLLRDLARQGRRVARLKGGDPFIFGRGGEELDRLLEWGIRFQVVPGITAASGCAAYAGIPLTHRDHAQSCIFVTGHRREGGVEVDFPALVRAGQTVVCYMGLHTLPALCAGMLEHGMDPQMPAALVEQGTTERQQVIVGTVSDLPQKVAQQEVHAPTLLIVGSVVTLRSRLEWFQGRPDGRGFG